MKQLAPQGEWLKSKILSGNKEIGFIFMGQNGEVRAKAFLQHLPYTMYLPNRTSPYVYTWPVNGCELYLIDTSSASASFIKTFVMCLFMHGATAINYISYRINKKFLRSKT